MRWFASFMLAFALAGSACAQDVSDAAPQLTISEPDLDVAIANEENLAVPQPHVNIPVSNQEPVIFCTGVAQQGGAVLCQTAPHAKVKVARSEDDFYFENADADGHIIIGFDRDEKENFIEAKGERVTFDLAARDYDISRIDGLPPSQVSTFSEAQLKRIRSSSARKKIGFASRQTELGFKDGFTSPVKDFRKTTNFGAQRILNGEEKRPHYGVDMAAPVGTPIYAPADGIVSLADDDLYFEGAMVMLDHGQGLISMYLHTDTILVEAGQSVKRGEQIATIGSKGRSTGPHLCWRLKWRNRNLDPELLTQWPGAKHEH
ncbi:MAG: M23 family metallopeptidase [Litorimonas sp.]